MGEAGSHLSLADVLCVRLPFLHRPVYASPLPARRGPGTFPDGQDAVRSRGLRIRADRRIRVSRVYWFFKGNFWARWSSYIPIHREQWQGMGSMLEFYLFMRFDPGHRVGHNPLAALSYVIIYLLILVEILTGVVLYSQVLGNPVLHQSTDWLPLLIAPSYLRLIHYFSDVRVLRVRHLPRYVSVLVSLEEENGLLDSIFSGWKFVPAGELRHEIAAIPEARRFAKRHELLPRGTPGEERAGSVPKPRPGPGPVALYRNWISFAGTGIVAVGVLVFVVLMAYHTIGGGALAQPYGDLVIFFLPPVFVFAGVVVILVGMYVQWIRWRMHKPLSFARYPKWDLNLASERKALLAVAIGAAILSRSGDLWKRPGLSLHGCRAVLRRRLPFHDPGVQSPTSGRRMRTWLARSAMSDPAPPDTSNRKIRGMAELVETIQNDYPRPIPVPVTALRPIRGNCEKCHWPANFFGSRELHRVHFLSDEQNTRWEIDMLVRIGGGGHADAVAAREFTGMSRAKSSTWPAIREDKLLLGCERWIQRPARPRCIPPRRNKPTASAGR